MNAPFAGKRGESAFARLCDELRPDLYRFAYWLARDRDVAEDVVQEALLRAWRSRDALQEGAAAKPWLLTIVRREHARLYERKRFDRMIPCLQRPYLSLPSMISWTLMKSLPYLFLNRSVFDVLKGYFGNEELALLFAFQARAPGGVHRGRSIRQNIPRR